ncbi:MAG: S1 RNA-binding domain-containing protein [Planctomycetota bacterium]
MTSLPHPSDPFPDSHPFKDDYQDPKEQLNISDADLDAMMAGSFGALAESLDVDALEAGDTINGIVIGVDDAEVLVEVDSKHHGAIDRAEFDDDVPAVGSPVTAHYRRYDAGRGLLLLAVREARKELFWDEISEGTVYVARVTGVNKGGLTVDIKGARAFLPISQIERGHVTDPDSYVGQELECEVTSFDRAAQDLVVSRRVILERQRDDERFEAVARFEVGAEVQGRVTQINQHGAFIDLGGVEGLLHNSKLHRRGSDQPPLQTGDSVRVEVVHVDREAGRIGLDHAREQESTWDRVANDYAVGDEATGLVNRITTEGACILLDEGVEGWIPPELVSERLRPGSLCKAVVYAVDAGAQKITLHPRA